MLLKNCEEEKVINIVEIENHGSNNTINKTVLVRTDGLI